MFGYDVGLITEAIVKNSDGTRQGMRDALEKLKGLAAHQRPGDLHGGRTTPATTIAPSAMGVLENGVMVPAE